MRARSIDTPHLVWEHRPSIEIACDHAGDKILGEGKIAVAIFDHDAVIIFGHAAHNHNKLLEEGLRLAGIDTPSNNTSGARYRINGDGSVEVYGGSTFLNALPEEIRPLVQAELDRLVAEYHAK